ncbi:MAG: ferritin-like domain-containing protein [Chloroflexi bacterium]|nr:ferritin-like domain-containing protein [Chloroflexota bacterium]
MTAEPMLRSDSAIDTGWMHPTGEWGMKATCSRKGLTIEDVDKGSYGPIYDVSDTATMRQRGAAARPSAPRSGRPWSAKEESWSASVAMLYEEACLRQWSSATDIPWTTLTPLSDEMELAMCQLCTFLTQVEFIAADLPGRWLQYISPDFYEVQLFLGTQIMDESRHEDVFRKRALANGGGLMRPGPGSSALLALQDFTEMTAIIHLVGEGFVQTMFRMGELVGQNEAEKKMFRLCAQDESRHVAFGVTHLKYLLETQPERREELHAYLDRFEPAIALSQAGLTTDGDVSEALGILLGGGKAHFDEGQTKLLAIRKRQVNEYAHRLDVIGMPERRERMHPSLKPYLG